MNDMSKQNLAHNSWGVVIELMRSDDYIAKLIATHIVEDFATERMPQIARDLIGKYFNVD